MNPLPDSGDRIPRLIYDGTERNEIVFQGTGGEFYPRAASEKKVEPGILCFNLIIQIDTTGPTSRQGLNAGFDRELK